MVRKQQYKSEHEESFICFKTLKSIFIKFLQVNIELYHAYLFQKDLAKTTQCMPQKSMRFKNGIENYQCSNQSIPIHLYIRIRYLHDI